MEEIVNQIKSQYSEDIERDVLGIILHEGCGFNKVFERIEPKDFGKPVHRTIFYVMMRLDNKNISIDCNTLWEEASDKERQVIEGRSFLVGLQEEIFEVRAFDEYIETIKRYSEKREISQAHLSVLKKSLEDNSKLEDLYRSSEESFLKISKKRSKAYSCTFKELMQRYAPAIIDRELRKSTVPSGMDSIDDHLIGLGRGSLVILAARPSMGKSALAMNMMVNIAEQKYKCRFISYEMTFEELSMRILSAETGVHISKIKEGSFSSDEALYLTNASTRLAELPASISEPHNKSISFLSTHLRDIKKESGLDIVFIDYLQLMHGDPGSQNRNLEIGSITGELKRIAKELKIVVVLLSQLSRNIDSRQEKRPILSDLRDSGNIEQDADVVAFLHREHYYTGDSDTKKNAELIFAKCRNGATGAVKLKFIPELARFNDKKEQEYETNKP